MKERPPRHGATGDKSARKGGEKDDSQSGYRRLGGHPPNQNAANTINTIHHDIKELSIRPLTY